MSTYKLTGRLFADMIVGGASNLSINAETVNDLNVFPIPDGDTGENMALTMRGGLAAAKNASDNLADASSSIAQSMLLSARGNSGVILSQFFAGIAEGFTGVDAADAEIAGKAFLRGVEKAYQAVIKPTEGTILTVAKDASHAAENHVQNMEDFFVAFIDEAKRSLTRTPDLLPILKEAGVVDSGGAGLVYIAEGMLRALRGETPELAGNILPTEQAELNFDAFGPDDEMKFGYCTELLLRLQNAKVEPEVFDISVIIDYLQNIGDSVVAFKTDSIVKIHVHTMTPEKVLSFCHNFGEFLTVKIENMCLQHNEAIGETKNDEPMKDYAVVTVASGEGIKETFLELGADVIVEGGQTDDPSAEDFLRAFDKAHAKTIIVLPNNGNIILAAKQAAELYKESEVIVIHSKTIGDGYAALSMLDLDAGSTEDIVEQLNDAIQGVITAEICQSVRDVSLNGITVKRGEYIGFTGKEMLVCSPQRAEAVIKCAEKLDMSEHEILILIRGKDTDEQEADVIAKKINEIHPSVEIFKIDGMQEIYDYILVAE